MKTSLLTVSFLTTLLIGTVAEADESHSAQQGSSNRAAEPGRWSFGAGIGTVFYGSDYGLYGASGAAGLAALGGSGGGTYGAVLIERTLSPALRLGASLTGSYADSERKGDEQPRNPSPDRTTHSSAGGGISLRWVLNPGDLVEISPLLIVGAQWFNRDGANYSASYDDQGQVFSRSETDVDGYGIYARLGFVVEYRLLTRLYLRLETHLLRVERNQYEESTRTESQGSPIERDRQTATGVSASFGVQPMLQIRILL